MEREPAIIVDIDGTVATSTGRGMFEWHRVAEDIPNTPIVTVVKALLASGHTILFVSGRMEQCRDLTENWLKAHVTEDHPFRLFMRPDGDYKSDSELKPEIYHLHIRPRYNVQLIIDDRASVVKTWREMGFTVMQVAEGNF